MIKWYNNAVCQYSVMSGQSGQSSQRSVQGLHIASLTHSQMIVLNLPHLQSLCNFTFDLVIGEDDEDEERRMVAFEEEEPRRYLLMVPAVFYASTKNNCRAFVELLCLCSQTITLPLAGTYHDQLTSLLSTHCIHYRYKKGKNVVKIYLGADCAVTYLDFVAFQAVHFKEKTLKELLAMKKGNAFQFCLAYFRDQLLPALFTGQEESVEAALEGELNKLRQLYHDLVCEDRFRLLYQLMNENGNSLKQLQKEVEALVMARHVTTVGDEECEDLIGQELESIVAAEMEKHRQVLKAGKQAEFIYVKIVYELLGTFRLHGFEVNDDKFLLLTSKVVENITALHQEDTLGLRKANSELAQTLQQQKEEISRLREETEALRQQLQTKCKKELSIVVQEKQEVSVKRSTSEVSLQRPISIKDLKEPLQLLNMNTPSKNTAKAGSLSRTVEKKGKAMTKKRVS